VFALLCCLQCVVCCLALCLPVELAVVWCGVKIFAVVAPGVLSFQHHRSVWCVLNGVEETNVLATPHGALRRKQLDYNSLSHVVCFITLSARSPLIPA
jgi:hypothetical protein